MVSGVKISRLCSPVAGFSIEFEVDATGGRRVPLQRNGRFRSSGVKVFVVGSTVLSLNLVFPVPIFLKPSSFASCFLSLFFASFFFFANFFLSSILIESPLAMLSEMGMRPLMGSEGDGFSGEDLRLLLREQRRLEAIERERDLNIYRSGSAPPTVEGSLSAIEGLFGGDVAGVLPDITRANNDNGLSTEEDLRSSPAYHSYYYSQVNPNPRLPPPLLSKEDWRSTQRFRARSSGLGGIGDQRKSNKAEDGGSRSLFSMQPGFNLKKDREVEPRRAPGSGEWLDEGADGLIGLPGIELGRHKSFADILQVIFDDTIFFSFTI